MALPGFELLFSSISQQIVSADDAAIVAVHWNLVSNGLRCCGAGETWPDPQNENHHGSESLPAGWNSDNTIYALRYVDPTSNRTYLMKALAMDGSLILHLVRCYDEKTVSTTIKSRDYVNDDLSNVSSAYANLDGLNSQLTKELYTPIKAGGSSIQEHPQQSARQSGSDTRHQGRSPLMEDPRSGPGHGGVGYLPPRQPWGPDIDDPFSVGRADLDPLSSGRGGGMFMDPRNFPGTGRFPPGRGPFGPGAPGFPPGSIPPGARFDPVGPPGVRPQPDPDHERRPDGYDDMFM